MKTTGRRVKLNLSKLMPVQLVAFYAIRPENGSGLFYSYRDPHGWISQIILLINLLITI